MELPQVISEVVALRMNEEVTSQLHSSMISLLDKQHARTNALEEQVEGLTETNFQLKSDVITLSKGLEQVQMQSVMCHAMLMHYVETHWEPIGHLFAQIGSLSAYGIVPPTGSCNCDIVNESFNSKGVNGPGTPSSLPSLESQSPMDISRSSPSPVNSVYYSTPFLSPPSVSSQIMTTEEFSDCIIIFQGALSPPPVLSSSIPGDLGPFKEINQGEVFDFGSSGVPLLGDEGWSLGGSGCDEVDPFAGRG